MKTNKPVDRSVKAISHRAKQLLSALKKAEATIADTYLNVGEILNEIEAKQYFKEYGFATFYQWLESVEQGNLWLRRNWATCQFLHKKVAALKLDPKDVGNTPIKFLHTILANEKVKSAADAKELICTSKAHKTEKSFIRALNQDKKFSTERTKRREAIECAWETRSVRLSVEQYNIWDKSIEVAKSLLGPEATVAQCVTEIFSAFLDAAKPRRRSAAA